MFAVGLFAGAGVAGAWDVQASASSSCSNGEVIINGSFTNSETTSSGDMNVTMTWKSVSDGPKLVAHQTTGSFVINSGQQSVTSGQVTFAMTWANGHSGTDSRTAWFGAQNCTAPPTSVTPSAPTSTTPTCQHADEVVTPSSQTGVIWTPAGSTTLSPGESVDYRATPAQGYTFPNGAQRDWSFKNSFDVSSCAQRVTPIQPSVDPTTPTCQQPDMTVSPNSQTGVVWSPAGGTTLTPGQSVVYTATPASGYAFPGKQARSWTYTDTLNTSSCSSVVHPDAPASSQVVPPAANGTPSGLPVGDTGDGNATTTGSQNMSLLAGGWALLLLAGGLWAPRLRRRGTRS